LGEARGVEQNHAGAGRAESGVADGFCGGNAELERCDAGIAVSVAEGIEEK
jgi:hypothetical protein